LFNTYIMLMFCNCQTIPQCFPARSTTYALNEECAQKLREGPRWSEPRLL